MYFIQVRNPPPRGRPENLPSITSGEGSRSDRLEVRRAEGRVPGVRRGDTHSGQRCVHRYGVLKK